jgi:hypothetical protein
MEYLSAAAANAASIETEALQAGRKGGGAAKGELVLAIFELANSFRHGWGVKKDPVAAKQVGLTDSFMSFENDEEMLIIKVLRNRSQLGRHRYVQRLKTSSCLRQLGLTQYQMP